MPWALPLAVLAWGCSPAERRADRQATVEFPVDTHCYLNVFEPATFPWKEAECLNYEEVFDHHTYVEVRSDPGAAPARVIVARFVRGEKVEDLAFIALPHRDTWILQATRD